MRRASITAGSNTANETQVTCEAAINMSGTGGMPRTGNQIGRGAEGVIHENLDQLGWVVKAFHQGGSSPFQARNEFQNLEKARAIRPGHVVKVQAPADPRQGWLVKEQVFPATMQPEMNALDDSRAVAEELVSFAQQQGLDLEPPVDNSMFVKGQRWIWFWRKDSLPGTGLANEPLGTLHYNMTTCKGRSPIYPAP